MDTLTTGRPALIRRVAIVGGGFSGALQAINLLRHDGPEAVLIERRPEAGRGVAYSASHPALLLNVRAANMSAFPDEPDHFCRWLEQRGVPADGFVPRAIYGEYLGELLDQARQSSTDRLRILQASAVAVESGRDGVGVHLDDGTVVTADALVLALGNLPPVPPDNLHPEEMPAGTYAPNPWTADIARTLGEDETVLIVGTGLTMVDAALLLEEHGFRGRIVALSRRGLTPKQHGTSHPVATKLSERPPLEASALLSEVRRRAVEVGWRAAVDELRPFTRSMWLAASTEQRRRFLRHLRPWWDVHRHRIAPAVAERLDRLRASGRLVIVAGKTQSFVADGPAQVTVRWRPRGQSDIEQLSVRRVINCSGPIVDIDRTEEPLLRQLRTAGLATSDGLGLGLATDRDGRLVGADGRPSDRIYALGPMTRGSFWEITAVPDIRIQTWTLARHLSNAHWVSAEGL